MKIEEPFVIIFPKNISSQTSEKLFDLLTEMGYRWRSGHLPNELYYQYQEEFDKGFLLMYDEHDDKSLSRSEEHTSELQSH